jgi:hypothetical protein
VTTQVENGKAFEWAIAQALSRATDGTHILDNTSKTNAEKCFWQINQTLRDRFELAADKAVQHILSKEATSDAVRHPLSVRISADSQGQSGDVRDVVLASPTDELGISCKTNHDAFKHSRLSARIDFVKKWGLDASGCSQDYWDAVRPLFQELAQLKQNSGRQALWRDLENRAERFFWPVLDAFDSELVRLTNINAEHSAEVSKNLVKYIVGGRDFFKVVCRPDEVEIQGFNLNESLSVGKTKYPDHVIGIDRLDGGQFSKTVRFNRGFTFNFRIHNASSRIEPSLKFDIRAVSLPPSESYTNHIEL